MSGERKRRGHGEGSVFERADGKWVAQLDLGRAPNGKRRRPKRIRDTRKEATEALRQLQREADAGHSDLDRHLTVGGWLDRWLADEIAHRVEVGTLRPKSAEAYTASARHVRRHIGGVKLSELKPGHIRDLHRKLLKQGLKPATVNRAHGALRKAINDAVADGLMAENPATKVSPPASEHVEAVVLTPDQSRMVLAKTADHRWGVAIMLALACGLRRGEVIGLRWEDLDLDGETPVLRVRRQVQRYGGELQESAPKTASGRRTIVLPDIVVNALREHRSRQRKERLACPVPWPDDNRVLTTDLGTTVEPTNLDREWRSIRAELGLPAEVTFHNLRHGAASLALSAGVPLKAVSEMLGHSTVQLTGDLYSHVLEDLKKATASTMNTYLTDDSASAE